MAITSQINCPLYRRGEQLILSDMALQLPMGKAACLILARDVTELLFLLKNNPLPPPNEHLFSCSGCQGIIKFKQLKPNNNLKDQTEIGFSGYLETLPPEELLQAINMNQKTGTLLLTFQELQATVSFRNGAVMAASHDEKKDKEAFYRILAERSGFFQFSVNQPNTPEDGAKPIGDFMNLLMEGLQKIDETE